MPPKRSTQTDLTVKVESLALSRIEEVLSEIKRERNIFNNDYQTTQLKKELKTLIAERNKIAEYVNNISDCIERISYVLEIEPSTGLKNVDD
jgi:hypothetical protein